VLLDVEADSYWCLTKLMDNIQDRYTFSQVNLRYRYAQFLVIKCAAVLLCVINVLQSYPLRGVCSVSIESLLYNI
jgi:hypothetical protein